MKAKPKKSVKQSKKSKQPPKKLWGTVSPQWLLLVSARAYLLLSVTTLLLSVLFWSLLGAKVHYGNADQLVNAQLFESSGTFTHATFPAAHSFLLKWPIFFAMARQGFHESTYMVWTVILASTTVSALMYILSRIERRPLVLGTICLALASCLMLVPIQPYPGALLPVNLAMTTTRNIEYVVYIAALFLIAKATTLRSWRMAGAVALLGIVIASDRLFVGIGLGGGVLMCAAYGILKQKQWVAIGVRWVTAIIAACLLAFCITAAVNALPLATIGGPATPYGITAHPKDLALGTVYAALGVLTNFGANPASDSVTVAGIASSAKNHVLSATGPAYMINLALFSFAALASIRLMGFTHSKRAQKSKKPLPTSHVFAMLLIASSITAIGSFIVTNHYYAVDARYLTIVFFALVIAATVALQGKAWRPAYVLAVGILSVIGLTSGMHGAYVAYKQSIERDTAYSRRNETVAHILEGHRTKLLVGDYWRVVPIKNQIKGPQTIEPLANCLQPRDVLTSSTWSAAAPGQSFAYLLSLDKSQTDSPQCNETQITAAYGLPNASFLIDGTFQHPKELLLFYDQGKQPLQQGSRTKLSASIVLNSLQDVTNTTCASSSVMNIVAHEDDDLLFLSPDLIHAINNKQCVRTVYLTAGEAGQNQSYWIARQRGAQAAYAHMAGAPNIWTQQTVKVADTGFITVASLQNNPQISLLFINLPDGNLFGQGFYRYYQQSLQALLDGKLASITTTDKRSRYTLESLTSVLADIIRTYSPSEIRAQGTAPYMHFADHSDHLATGTLATRALQESQLQIPLHAYAGYPVREHPENISGEDLAQKQAAFSVYATLDGAVCRSHHQCPQENVYEYYVPRQYRISDLPLAQ